MSERLVQSILKVSAAVCSLAFVVVIAGCGGGSDDQPDVYPVSGTVMYKGAALEGATVSFWAEGAPRPASGVTGPDGKFQLSMFEANDGALAGENRITVTKTEGGAAATAPPTSSSSPPTDPSQLTGTYLQQMGMGAPAGPTSAIPMVYANPDTTPLKETVSASSENNFVLQLTE